MHLLVRPTKKRGQVAVPSPALGPSGDLMPTRGLVALDNAAAGAPAELYLAFGVQWVAAPGITP
jgi:hypothetical protein